MPNFLTSEFWLTVIIINYVIALGTAAFVVLHNRNPTKTIAFILALVALPFIGIFIYYFFGQEYRKSKIFTRRYVAGHKRIKEWEQKLLLQEFQIENLENDDIRQKAKIIKLIQKNQRAPVTFENNVQVLNSGEEKFDALFKDIEKAKHHIHIEYYIFNSDAIGNEFIEILCRKSKAGVSVKLCYDYVVSELSSKAIKKMKKAGIVVRAFMPVWFPNLTRKLNYRDHKKIVVIDGIIGYVGGINVCEDYVNGKNKKGYWRDTHARIEGHAVKSIQTQFLYTWDFVTDKKIEIEKEYYPELSVEENIGVQIAASGPDTNFPNIMEAMLMAINTARKYIYITTPYFIPNEEILTALCTASRSGIEVKIIVPEKGDSWAARYATNSYIGLLLESGVEVHHYCKGMVHAKTIVIDDIFTTIGTCNMDNRSFNLNFEINALIYNEEVSKEMVNLFNEDINECTAVNIENWNNRSFLEKTKESFCRLWAALL